MIIIIIVIIVIITTRITNANQNSAKDFSFEKLIVSNQPERLKRRR
jgi:hypothetical protein